MSVQNCYNIVNRVFDIAKSEVSIREKCGLLAYSPLAGGRLSGKYLNGKRPKNCRYTLWPGRFSRHLTERGELAVKKYVNLNEGDWLIQDAANSGVGHCLIRLAKQEGVKTVNVVRREGLDKELDSLPDSYDTLIAFAEGLASLSVKSDWKYVEPNDLYGIWAEASPNRPVRPLSLIHI